MKLGGWQVGERLGAGGMGEVYLARRGDETAALKLIRQDLATDPTFRARFSREVEACRRVTGERVAVLLDADISAPRMWMAVKYVPGPTLAQHVEAHGPLRGQTLAGLAVGLADALTAIHAAGVIHRDLKPANVILTHTQPVVIDFGVAAARDAATLTATGAFVGTPGWIAPEAMLGTAGPHPQQDVWAWGATVLFAATGSPPHGDGPVAALHWRAANLEPDPALIQQVPDALRALVAQALATDPGERPPAGDLMARVLDALGVVEIAPATVIAETWAPGSLKIGPPPLPLPRRRARWPLVAAALFVVPGAVGAGWWAATLDDGGRGEAIADAPGPSSTSSVLGSTTSSTSTTPPATDPPTTTSSSVTVPTTASPPSLGPRPEMRDDGPWGSGCSPGAGALPDGWWFGYPTSPIGNGPAFSFDLACFSRQGEGSNDPAVRNDSTALREVPLAQGAELICLRATSGPVVEGACTSSSPGAGEWGVWVRVQRGRADRVIEQYAP